MCTILRQVKPDDGPFLYELYADTRRDELESWGWDAEQRKQFIDLQFNAQRQSYQLQYPQAVHQIIIEQNSTGKEEAKPLGRLLTQRTDQEIRLIDISLLSQHRNEGIGSKLIKDLLREAKDLDVPLRLSVSTMNPARHLYERLGFVVTVDHGIHLEMESNSR